MKNDNCIFCKLAAGDIPTNTIYEDELFRIILDNGPATKGHALILPKDHVENLYELPDELAAKVMVLAKKMAIRIKDALSCDGLNIVQNNGEVAGQTVMHYHLHLIPRYRGDGQRILWKPTTATQEELQRIVEEIVK